MSKFAHKVLSRLCAFLAATLLVTATAPVRAVGTEDLPDIGAPWDAVLSQGEENQIGRMIVHRLRDADQLLDDPELGEYIQSIGHRLSAHAQDSGQRFDFFMVRDPTINAFALPGGYIGVNAGLLLATENESELAGVLAHEIEHVVQRHSVKQMEQVQQANVGVGLVCILTRVCENQAAQAAIQVGGSAYFAKNSREDEVQADEGGFQTLARAGINPRGMLTFFQKLLAEEGSGGSGGVNAWFADHPGTQDRIADIQRMLDAVPAAQLSSLRSDSPQFQQMKRRVAQLPPAPPPRQ